MAVITATFFLIEPDLVQFFLSMALAIFVEAGIIRQRADNRFKADKR